MMNKRSLLILTIVFTLFLPTGAVSAQNGAPEGPVYIVQEGDTLWSIAVRFGVSVEELQTINNLSNANQLMIGDQLIIPGLEGASGVIVTETIPFGESLRSLSRSYQLPPEILKKLNHLTVPSELFAGRFLTIPQQEGPVTPKKRTLLSGGLSLIEISAIEGSNPWEIVFINNLQGTWDGAAGDVLQITTLDTGISEPAGPTALPAAIRSIEINPLPFLQGKTTAIKINAEPGITFSGTFMGHDLHIYPDQNDVYVALQGAHAMAEPGLYPMQLNGSLADGSSFSFSQMVPLAPVDYLYDRPLIVNPTTIDPAVTKPEDAQWNQLALPATPERLWDGIFEIPSPLPVDYCLETGDCFSSRFGNRRSYNGSPYNSFHTGLDIVGTVGTDIYAPAPGTVVFAGPLTVRGNATMINHGWGVYTAYMHQDEILVQVGDQVETGQLIGKIGSTGRLEGPHLHWEVWAGGVQVDPLEWLEQAYP